MRLLILIFGLTAAAMPAPAAAAAAPDSDEMKASERLSERVRETLDGMLGAGRVKLLIEIRGERLEVQSESEIVSPLDKGSEAGKAAAHLLALPGYTKGRSAADVTFGGEKPDEKQSVSLGVFFQKEHEHSRRDSGFEIKSIAATVVFDSALSSDSVREASQILPQLLRLDTVRGDTLTIVRAPLLPAWKSAFATPKDWRAAAYVSSAALIALLVALIGGLSFIRAARVFATELARRRDSPMATEEMQSPMLPELSSGLPLGLVESDATGGGAAAPLALGRRFDFLVNSDGAATARILNAVPAPELALMFGYLAEGMPETASRLFALLPAALQAETSRSLLKLSVAEPERLAALEDRLRTAIENGVEGPQRLAKILSRVSGDTRAEMLDRLAVEDARGVEDVQSRLFSFEDIVRLTPAELRRLLGAIPYESWGAALRGAPNALLDRVLADLPEGPRQFVRDAAQTPQTRDKIIAARSTVLDALAGLAAKGELQAGKDTPGGGLV